MSDRGVWRRIALPGLFGACFAVAFIGLASGGDVDRMTFGDGRLHRIVATDLGADDSTVSPTLAGSGPALRYGRIGLPVVLWAVSAGRPAIMRYAQPAIMVASAAGIAIVSALLLQTRSPFIALAPFLAVGLTASLAGGFSEPLSVLVALIAVLLVERDRPWAAAVALGCAMFARENAVVVVVGLSLWLGLQRRVRDAAVVAGSMVPIAAWHFVVERRFDHLPLRDPWLVETGALGAPFAAVADALGRVSAIAVVVIVVHLVVGAVGLILWRRSMLGAVAAIAALPILSTGEFSWRYIGDASRLGVFLQVFVILALARMYLTKPDGPSRKRLQPGAVEGQAVAR